MRALDGAHRARHDTRGICRGNGSTVIAALCSLTTEVTRAGRCGVGSPHLSVARDGTHLRVYSEVVRRGPADPSTRRRGTDQHVRVRTRQSLGWEPFATEVAESYRARAWRKGRASQDCRSGRTPCRSVSRETSWPRVTRRRLVPPESRPHTSLAALTILRSGRALSSGCRRGAAGHRPGFSSHSGMRASHL